MNKLIYILVLLLPLAGMTQNFSKVYWGDDYGDLSNSNFHITSGDTLYSLTEMQNNFRLWNRRSFDRSGNVIDSTGYEFDTTVFSISDRTNGLAQISENRLVSLLDVWYKNGNAFTNLYLFNAKLDSIKSVEFKIHDSTFTTAFDLLVEDSVITVLGHYTLPNKKLSLYLARYDTALNLQWYKTIDDFRPIANQYFNGYYPYKMIRKGNAYYLAGRALYTTQFVEGFLVKTDLQGNKLWDKRYQYQNHNGLFTSILSFKGDSMFLPFTYNNKVTGTVSWNMIQFRWLDTNGIAIKDSVYPDEEELYLINNVTQAKDGNILLAGRFYYGGMKSLIWKMDKNLNTIWRRVYYYGDWEDESFLYNIGQWSDGGIVSVGSYFDRYLPTNQMFNFQWILSTDANGCLDNSCGSDIGVVEWAVESESVNIFPNPAKEFVTIQLPPNHNNGIFRLYNSTGKMVLKTTLAQNKSEVPLPDLTAGTFVAEIITEGTLYVKKLVVE